MNCQEFWSRSPESWATAEAEWTAHLRECPSCEASWARQQHLSAGLRRLSVEWSRTAAPARVEHRVMDAFRAQAGISAARRTVRPWLGALTWATAGLTVMALAISLVRVHDTPTASPKRIPHASILASLQEPQEGASDATGNGFMTLPNVEPLAPNEGDVVRLELPRSAMMALGFDVSPERAAEPVQAEVLYGPDGVARAVRFLDDAF